MLDLKSAYHQVPTAEEDQDYTAFETNGIVSQGYPLVLLMEYRECDALLKKLL